MTGLLTLLVSVVVFGVVVLVHELGHFLAARRCGIHVEEFSIGFGPAVWSHSKNGTRYTVRLLPLGGFNMLAGEKPEEDEEEDGQAPAAPPPPAYRADAPLFPAAVCGKAYAEASPWQRFFVIASGALMNFVAGLALLLVLAGTEDVLTSCVIYDFTDNAASHQTGLQEDDQILAVNGHRCFVIQDVFYELQRTADYTADFTVLRSGRRVVVPNVAFDTVTDENGDTQMQLDFRVYGIAPTPRSVGRAALANFAYYARSILRGFIDLATGRTGINELSGPVGVVSAVGQAVQYGWRDVLSLAALLTINLGIFNLLPIPALDGFKLWFLAFEGITRREVPAAIQNGLNTAGMVLLLWLMLFVTMQDIGKFF